MIPGNSRAGSSLIPGLETESRPGTPRKEGPTTSKENIMFGRITAPLCTFLAATAFVAALAASPSFAQHGHSGGDGHHQDNPGGATDHMGDMTHGAMMEHMGDVSHGAMMEHMNTMMNHMTESLGDMQGLHMGSGEPGHGDHSGPTGDHLSMMNDMSAEMGMMLPHMEAMLGQMRSFMDGNGAEHAEGMHDSMEGVMQNMDTMMQACREVMTSLHGMAATPGSGPGEPEQDDHRNHDH